MFAKALDLIAKERASQIADHGYSVEHDDEHDLGEIALAAAEFAAPYSLGLPHDSWAFSRGEHSRIEQLAMAGALIVAEMERLMRLEQREAEE